MITAFVYGMRLSFSHLMYFIPPRQSACFKNFCLFMFLRLFLYICYWHFMSSWNQTDVLIWKQDIPMFVTVLSIASFTKIEPLRYEHLFMNTLVHQNHTLQATNYSNYENTEIPLILQTENNNTWSKATRHSFEFKGNYWVLENRRKKVKRQLICIS